MSNDLKLKTAQLRRQHILDAAIRVFGIHGFRGATIRSIAEEAGVADGTVYNVFENKEALLLAILEPLLIASQPTAPRLDGTLDPTKAAPHALLQGMITAQWTTLNPEVLAMMRVVWSEALTNRQLACRYREQILAPANELPIALFQDLADRGSIATSDVPMTVRIIVASFLGLALLTLLGDELLEERASDVPQLLADILLNGLLPRNGAGVENGAA
jgi:AcrR family transcriptional regulator